MGSHCAALAELEPADLIRLVSSSQGSPCFSFQGAGIKGVPHHLQPKSNIVYRYQVKRKEIDSVTLRFIIAFTLLMVNLQLW